MILIFAVDKSWDIGFGGKMLAEIKEDLKRFRQITEGHIVIMGRKTLEAIPGQNPLPNRINILVSRSDKYKDKGFHILNDLEKLDDLIQELDPEKEKEVFVTGGQSIVNQLMHRCSRAYITKILKDFPEADTAIPNLDKDKNWEKIRESEIYYQGDIPFQYVDYRHI